MRRDDSATKYPPWIKIKLRLIAVQLQEQYCMGLYTYSADMVRGVYTWGTCSRSPYAAGGADGADGADGAGTTTTISKHPTW